MFRRIGHHQISPPGVAEQFNAVGAEMRAQVLEIVDLIGERVGLPLRRRRPARAALVVEDHAALLCEHVPRRRYMLIGVVEAWTAINDDQRRIAARAEHFVVNVCRLPFKGRAVLIASQRRNSDKGRENDEGGADPRFAQTSARILIHKQLHWTQTTSWKTDIVQEPRHKGVHCKYFCSRNLMGSHYLGKSRNTIPQALTALIFDNSTG